jgi:hypothetical protein
VPTVRVADTMTLPLRAKGQKLNDIKVILPEATGS